jgi:hypothetical protein
MWPVRKRSLVRLRSGRAAKPAMIGAVLARLGSLSVALLLFVGCADDVVDNPFNATDGESSSSTSANTGDGDDDGGPGDTTAAPSTTSGSSEGDGTTLMIADSSSGGSAESSGGSTDEGGESSSSEGGESSSSGEPPMLEVCPAGEIPNAPLPSTVMGSSLGEDSEFSSGCGGGGAPDVAFTFVAPADGDYTFDTQGTAFDTVLHVLDGVCSGPVLECNDDGIVGTSQSMLSVSLVQGQEVTVVADAFGLQGGNVTVNAREGSVSCPIDIGSTVPQTISGQTLVATDEFTASCGSGASADQGYLFTPPQDATYTFEITNNTFDTILSVRGGECAGPELQCNDNLPGSLGGASGLALGLPAGEPVTIVVDGSFGAAGTYDLNVGMLEGDCPDEDLGALAVPFTVSGSTVGEDNASAGSCGGLGSADWAYTWTAPADATYRFSTSGSDFDTVVYVLDESCTGAELACGNDTPVDTSGSAAAPLAAGQAVVIVVDGSGQEGDFQLEVDFDCPSQDLGSTVPQTVSDQNFVATDAFVGTCGLGAGTDQAFTFTAPEAGTYTFETAANTFDTILYALDGTCGGAEIACNDNLDATEPNGSSGFLLDLAGGQEITLVVDGSFGGQGTFDLVVGQLEGDCPDGDLGAMAPPFTVSGSTVGEDNATAGTCGGLGSSDFAYTWTAPFEATFRFDTEGSAFDTVVYVIDGTTCTGAQLGCGDDSAVGEQGSAAVHLVAGQSVTVVVDGNGQSGAFDLTVDVECPAQDLGSLVPQVITDQTLVATDEFLGSCGLGAANDQGFTFTAPVAGTYTFETLNADFDTILYVLNGTCGGAELACNDNIDPMGFTGESGLAVVLAAGQTVTAVVDGSFGSAGTFDLAVGQLSGDCPDEDLGAMAVPFTVSGSTAGEDNATTSSCGGLGSPDYAYVWTAPAGATYLFSTEGSAFDTVLHVHAGALCTGVELACNDDDGVSPQSFATAYVEAGEDVVIVVDGDGASGAFDLLVDEAGDSGNCCFAHAGGGCDDAGVEACVCAFDGFCCAVQWDATCVDEGLDICGATCI